MINSVIVRQVYVLLRFLNDLIDVILKINYWDETGRGKNLPNRFVEVFEIELRIFDEESTTFEEVYRSTKVSEVIDEPRVVYDGDRHIVTSQLDGAAKDALKRLMIIALDPNLTQTVTRLEIDIAVENCGSSLRAAYH